MPTLKWYNGSAFVETGLRNPEGDPLGSVWGDHDVKWWNGSQWVTVYSAVPPILSTGEILPSSFTEDTDGDKAWTNPSNLLTVANTASVRFTVDGEESNTVVLSDWGLDTLLGDKVGSHSLIDLIIRIYRGDSDDTGINFDVYSQETLLKIIASDNFTINETPETADKDRYNPGGDFTLENVAVPSLEMSFQMNYNDFFHTFGTRTFSHITIEVLYQEN